MGSCELVLFQHETLCQKIRKSITINFVKQIPNSCLQHSLSFGSENLKNCVSHLPSVAELNLCNLLYDDDDEAIKMTFLQSFVNRFMPTVKADDEELVDPQKVLREKCSGEAKCSSLQEKLNTCNDRVNSRKQTTETCLEELIDYVGCVDHCVAHSLFKKLK